MMSVHTLSRNSRSCDTTMRVFFQRCRYSSSQITARRSRWLVGSSSRSNVGWMKRARAREMRMRHPPEKVCVARTCMEGVKPSPLRILAARPSAASAFFSRSPSYTWMSRSWAASRSTRLPSSSLGSGSSPVVHAVSCASSLRSSTTSTSASITALSADRSSPMTSCSTSSTSMYSGTGICRRASSRKRVDLPIPFGPTRP
mmetsp:Transcript_20853/g.45700  ORF Transcript_20853/g.45700 Transcript_20853/m.45700 type:complete len:201 (+) Transcript_20853:437-1039(+)